MALALELRCRVTAEVADSWSTRHVGPEPYLGDEDHDAVLAAARAVSDQPLRIEIANHVPLCRGLGSSAAAFTAGTLAALRANGKNPSHDELFQYAKYLEGHPDNAAAAVYGGLVSVAEGWVVHHSLTPDLVPVLVVPDFEILTSDSRKVVPDCVPLDVAVRTLGRLTALIEGLRTGSGEILDNARGDEIHEMPRLASYPETARLMEVAVRSGSRVRLPVRRRPLHPQPGPARPGAHGTGRPRGRSARRGQGDGAGAGHHRSQLGSSVGKAGRPANPTSRVRSGKRSRKSPPGPSPTATCPGSEHGRPCPAGAG